MKPYLLIILLQNITQVTLILTQANEEIHRQVNLQLKLLMMITVDKINFYLPKVRTEIAELPGQTA